MNERMRKLRKALDLTQQEFAKRIGSSQNVVANYETGHRNPSRSVINNICKTFHVNEDWLRTGTGEMFYEISRFDQIDEFVGITLINKPHSFQMRFLYMLSALSESDWEVLERMAYAIIEGRESNVKAPEVKEALAGETVPPGYSSREELKAEARAEAERYYEQVLSEKLQGSQASSAKEPGVG